MKIGVIMGGVSSEREISLRTGEEIANNIDKSKYEVCKIIIDSEQELVEKVKGIDFALLALHGKFGEDGTVQGVLETVGIPYSGCGVLSSAICMDKDVCKTMVRAAGLNTADWFTVKSADKIDYEAIEKMGYPVVVKPNSGGSSVATYIINNKEEILNAVEDGLKYDNEVMIEKFIKGDEITCCIMDGEMLPVLVIKPRSTFFDYTSKYTNGGADEYVVQLEEALHKKVEYMALKAWEALKCSVYTRIDMIVKEGEPFILEANTLPGMTKNSLFPKSASSVGISFPKLIDMIIEKSLKIRAKL